MIPSSTRSCTAFAASYRIARKATALSDALTLLSDFVLVRITKLWYPTLNQSIAGDKPSLEYVRVELARPPNISWQRRLISPTWYHHRHRSWPSCGGSDMDYDVSYGSCSNSTIRNQTHFRHRQRCHMSCVCKDLILLVTSSILLYHDRTKLIDRVTQVLSICQSIVIHLAVEHGLGRHLRKLNSVDYAYYNKVKMLSLRHALVPNIDWGFADTFRRYTRTRF